MLKLSSLNNSGINFVLKHANPLPGYRPPSRWPGRFGLLRDLDKLKPEIELYRDEEKMWQIEKQISNSAGSLCVHLTGSLNHFIGAQLGHTGYVRNRGFQSGNKTWIIFKQLLKLFGQIKKQF